MEQDLGSKGAQSRLPPVVPRVFRLGLLLLILVTILTASFLYFWTDNEARLNKIQGGMTITEVDEILGAEPNGISHKTSEISVYYWTFHDGTAFVWIDPLGKVRNTEWHQKSPTDSNLMEFFQRVFRKLGL